MLRVTILRVRMVRDRVVEYRGVAGRTIVLSRCFKLILLELLSKECFKDAAKVYLPIQRFNSGYFILL